MKKDKDEDQRVKKLIGEITKLLPERSKIKTDLLYFKYAPILVMLMRWYGVSQFYDNKMEITLWYENLVVSDNKDAMSAEVDAMLRQSKAILESVDYNKMVVESCEGMLQQLNPQIAKEKEQSEKINKLEGKVSGIEGKIDKMMGWLQQTMSK